MTEDRLATIERRLDALERAVRSMYFDMNPEGWADPLEDEVEPEPNALFAAVKSLSQVIDPESPAYNVDLTHETRVALKRVLADILEELSK